LATKDFFHKHPYDIFIPDGTTKIIVGTLPPPRFSINKLKEKDVNFCYGSCDGTLWPVLNSIFNLSLRFDNSLAAVEERKAFLHREHIGICDIVASCKRDKVDASDLGMYDTTLRDILFQLRQHPSITTIIFTGGNSKNGPEYFFRKQLKEKDLRLTCIDNQVPKRHTFFYSGREITTISITSPSNAANRAIGSMSLYKTKKAKDQHYTTFDFRIEQYKLIFLSSN
jgi:G:T/U-mismatch repair DNA glycosylase